MATNGCGLTGHSDFVLSLRLLVEREQYSLLDIGLMFGVSRERVRQWCQKHEIYYSRKGAKGLLALRVWNDKTSRFYPVSRALITKANLRQQAETSKRVRDNIRNERRQKILDAAVALKAKLNRDPTLSEIAETVLGRTVGHWGGAILSGMWGGGKTTKDRYGSLAAALEQVGVHMRPRGLHGHIDPTRLLAFLRIGKRQTYCKRGHLLAETRNKYGRCQICESWRNRVTCARLNGKPIPPEPIESLLVSEK